MSAEPGLSPEVYGVQNGAPGLHWTDIAERLANHWPEHYRDITADAISAQLRALDVPKVDVRRDGAVRKGARADAVRAAHQHRQTVE